MGAATEIHFVDELIKKTVEKQLEWRYFTFKQNDTSPDSEFLSEINPTLQNASLREYVADRQMPHGTLAYDFSNSYWTLTNTGYIYFFSYIIADAFGNEELAVQSDKNSKVNQVYLYSDNNAYLFRLHNAIRYAQIDSNYDEIQNFMNSFLSEE